ncbi:TonB-dependent receptor [Caulobacter vibrioides]|uniref:TonB-dependent receptor n=1 Tax=Caulobacter vibrioides (strain NA1000 / CB15N) TaxID=565050 RepID=A0A0H3C6A4_CAUVN|nr:TonB-dependent receptor [Caulobacter vibrioides]YP_002516394.2 TonB-dependent receptor [Caulobacter vibrioides NA1000]ACL94486.2 TonB-dependent receptor [Caulobacter vibrioides NA1000]ATC27804.1 TonB-dependent receptor [Caulobacter vibrioides]QXZ53046.1 TonB-dependent receptor [Caulobacter vibrioides]
MSQEARKSVLKRGLTLALVAGASQLALASGAFAQQAADNTQVEEVVVTGVRGSQLKSVDLKRKEAAIVDAISAEDIGKLPDVTIADSLQRISGVQIQRNAGEGATVNIRGLAQVITLLNGEQYLSAGNMGSAQPNLLDVPSQLMNQVLVYKSTNPRNALSGISGTLDLKTRRPFDFKNGFTVTGAAEAQRGERTKEDDYLLNGVVNWRNDRVGLMLSAAGSKANLGNNSSGVVGLSGNNDWGGSAATNFVSPHGFESFNRVVERKRLGVNASFQADLGEGFTLIAEGFYAKLDEYNRGAGINISNRWDGGAFGNWTKPTVSQNTGVNSPANGRPWAAVDEYDIDAWWVNSFSVNRTTKSESKNYNLELKYDNGGPFTSEVRAIRASGDRLSMNGQAQGDLSNWQYGPNRFTLFRDANDRTRGPFYPKAICDQYPSAQRSNAVVGSAGGCYLNPNPQGYGQNPQLRYNISGDHPVWSGFDRPITGGLGAGKSLKDYMANKDSYAIGAFSSEGNNEVSSDMNVFRAEGHYRFDDKFLGFITKIDAGVRQSDRSVSVEQFHLFSGFYGGVPGAVQANGSAIPAGGCEAQWKAIDVVMSQNQCQAGEFVPDPITGKPVFQGYTVNRPTKLTTYNNTIWVDDLGGVTSGIPGFWAIDPRDFDDAEAFHKKVFGGAIRVTVPGQTYDVTMKEQSAYGAANFEIGNLHGDFGLRVIQTELNVKQNLTGDTRNYGDTNADAGDSVSKRKYTDWLPSLNAVYDVNDNWKFRFAYAKTMQPLDLGNYGGGLSIFTADCGAALPNVRCVTGAAASGNPNLDPWRASNFDGAIEYYFGRASMLNISAFQLKIDSFVTGGTTTGRFPDQDGVIRRTVNVSLPVQGDGGSVKGLEVGAKVAFSDVLPDMGVISNFGVDSNYTYSPSHESRLDLEGNEIPFFDNSKHQFNLVGWYQDDKLQARVAYNYRTDRLSGTMGGGGNAVIPIMQKATGYVDVNVSYNVRDNVTVYFNGSNVTGEIEDYYLRFAKGKTQYANQNEFEPRYTLGIRARW